jgi:hypothetical protein
MSDSLPAIPPIEDVPSPARDEATGLLTQPRPDSPMPEQNATSRAARVLWLMDRSFKARQDADLDAERDALVQASAVDAALVAEAQAGIASGDVPDIEIDPRGWNRYYLSAQERDSARDTERETH